MKKKEKFIQYLKGELSKNQIETIEQYGWDSFVSYDEASKTFRFSMNINLSVNEEEL